MILANLALVLSVAATVGRDTIPGTNWTGEDWRIFETNGSDFVFVSFDKLRHGWNVLKRGIGTTCQDTVERNHAIVCDWNNL